MKRVETSLDPAGKSARATGSRAVYNTVVLGVKREAKEQKDESDRGRVPQPQIEDAPWSRNSPDTGPPARDAVQYSDAANRRRDVSRRLRRHWRNRNRSDQPWRRARDLRGEESGRRRRDP